MYSKTWIFQLSNFKYSIVTYYINSFNVTFLIFPISYSRSNDNNSWKKSNNSVIYVCVSTVNISIVSSENIE